MKHGILAVLSIAMSCAPPEDIVASDTPFYDLDSLVKAQVIILSRAQEPVSKEVRIGSESESMEAVLDSAQWVGELAILRDLDLNLPRYVGAFEITKSQISWLYTRKEGQEVAPIVVEYYFEGGNLKSLKGKFLDDKARSVYTAYREYNFSFVDGRLSQYYIAGYQTMILRDTTRFEIVGKVN